MLNSKVEIRDGLKLIWLEGRIDMSNADEFEEIVLNDIDQVKKISVDFGKLTFIDSTGVGNLVSAIQTSHKKDVRFEMINIPEGIEQILSIIGVFDVLKSLYEN